MDNEKKDAVEAKDGAELEDAQLEGVAGGAGGAGWHWYCPECGSTNLRSWKQVPDRIFECLDCGHCWENW